jgi:hypothetical protein
MRKWYAELNAEKERAMERWKETPEIEIGLVLGRVREVG